MITLFGFLPYFAALSGLFAVIAFLTDYFNWWGGGGL
jgi:hypothetical protein